jgi:hypothetical protein
VAGARPIDLVGALAVIIGVASLFIRVAQLNGRVANLAVGTYEVTTLVTIAAVVLLVVWLEALIWGAISRGGSRGDKLVWIGMHVAVLVGFAFALTLSRNLVFAMTGERDKPMLAALLVGSRIGFTFMGYVVLLRVLQLVAVEVMAVHPRRLYAIGLHSWIESFRKTRIPWAVLAIFVVILAFTHWFLVPPDAQRQAELSRLYVGTLMLLCSILLTVMVAILTPISLPNDIRFQTIYTVVTKPVRRLEVVWGRILGFMAVVTVLILLLGGGSLIYLYRNVGGRVELLKSQVAEARRTGATSKAEQLEGQLDQLQTRMSARVPVHGSLTFIDSVGQPQLKGIDVGQELEVRSHVEGATQAKAVWMFGANLAHPIDRLFPDPNRQPRPPVEAPLPLNLLLRPGTIEYVGNEVYTLNDRKAQLEQEKQAEKLSGDALQKINRRAAEVEAQFNQKVAEYEGLRKESLGLLSRADEAEKAGKADEAKALRDQAADLSSPPVQVQMTFTVYRTTKGRPGEPVYASIKALNPFVTSANFSDTFSIKEYYTNKWQFPASVLVGSRGYLNLEVQCLSPTQYLGIAESDLFVVANQGSFWANYLKGMLGIWLQAMVLTAIGVWAGTFLSWPVALLTTVFFFIAGEVLFPVLSALAANAMQGGGPFESMIRLVSHENQMSDLDSTLGVVLARSFDSIVVPLMSRLIYVIPNFGALDVSNTVADGFAVSWGSIGRGFLLALAYALPFSIAGYFILKNREVAA